MITAVASKKGGVGKTTSCVNLAAALAGIGKRVLLIDLDSQASASLSLGVARDDLAPSSADVLLRSLPCAQVLRPTRIDGLDLITASSDLAGADQFMSLLSRKESRLRSALRSVEDLYHFILIDCPSGLGLVPTNALVAADNFLLPANPHFLAIEGIRNLLGTVERLYERFGTRTALLGIVLTMVDYRTRAARDNVDKIRRQYGEHVFAVEIRVNVKLAEAPGEGKTIFEHAPDAPGAKAYRLLAAEMLIRSSTTRHQIAAEAAMSGL